MVNCTLKIRPKILALEGSYTLQFWPECVRTGDRHFLRNRSEYLLANDLLRAASISVANRAANTDNAREPRGCGHLDLATNRLAGIAAELATRIPRPPRAAFRPTAHP